jgi:hypothetical protein
MATRNDYMIGAAGVALMTASAAAHFYGGKLPSFAQNRIAQLGAGVVGGLGLLYSAWKAFAPPAPPLKPKDDDSFRLAAEARARQEAAQQLANGTRDKMFAMVPESVDAMKNVEFELPIKPKDFDGKNIMHGTLEDGRAFIAIRVTRPGSRHWEEKMIAYTIVQSATNSAEWKGEAWKYIPSRAAGASALPQPATSDESTGPETPFEGHTFYDAKGNEAKHPSSAVLDLGRLLSGEEAGIGNWKLAVRTAPEKE